MERIGVINRQLCKNEIFQEVELFLAVGALFNDDSRQNAKWTKMSLKTRYYSGPEFVLAVQK